MLFIIQNGMIPKVDFFGTPMYAKFIYQQGSDLKYTKSAVIKEEDPEEREF